MYKQNSLYIDANALDLLPEILERNNVSGNILYVIGPVVDKIFGLQIESKITAYGKIHKRCIESNKISYAMKLAEEIINLRLDFIVGVGSGKVLDVCKYVSHISKKPMLSIPTAISNDGVASPIAVLKKSDDKPVSLGCTIPQIILLDTQIILSSPENLIKAGIGDTISNYTALLDWKLAYAKKKDTMNGYAYMISSTALETLLCTQHRTINLSFIETLARSLIVSGLAMDIAGSSRPVSGSEHLFSHALDYYAPIKNLHGLQTALGTVAVLKITGQDDTKVLTYLQKFSININPLSLQIDSDTFIYCMQHAVGMRKDRYTYLHEADLSTKHLQTVYQMLVREL